MLSLLLHMHQPDYRDPETGIPLMPWVRLHATRGYTDVPALVKSTGARVTLNLVPSLIDQWEHYARGGTDAWLDLARRPAEALAPHEIAWILGHFFAGHPATFTWFPAWGRLRARAEGGGALTVQELRDVQVWSNLAWFGFTALAEHPFLVEVRRKGQGFVEAEKHAVLDAQLALVRGLQARWRGLPEVSATPYYHPILPLLIDTSHARRCMPDVSDPGFAAPDDALLQLTRARERVSGFVGAPVTGLWPSEGSVSPEVLKLAVEAGFTWVATDEDVLQRSERLQSAEVGARELHRGVWVDEATGVRLLARDHGLSDRIGFVYATWPGEVAARDLAQRLPVEPEAAVGTGVPHAAAQQHRGRTDPERAGGRSEVRESRRGGAPVSGVSPQGRRGSDPVAPAPASAPSRPVLLALDGENPWEGYPDAGEGFLRGLFARVVTQTCCEMAAGPVLGTIRRVHTGSWIDANFRIWIGHAEDRAAWGLLRDARAAWVEAGRPDLAREHLLAAEGSDWFWWFGDDFSTPFAHLFDANFRAHLRAAWRAIGRPVPASLGVPVRASRSVVAAAPLAALPEHDGQDWFAWAGAGILDVRASSMAPLPGTPSRLRFGDRGGRLAVRLDAPGGRLAAGWRVQGVRRGDDTSTCFEDVSVSGRATLSPDVVGVVLHGPSGQRLPAEGTYVLPWREVRGPSGER